MTVTTDPGALGLHPDVEQRCREVLALLVRHRRAPDEVTDLDAFGPQLGQLAMFVSCDDPILFTLPAFPCKSPNRAKVLGVLPDEAERRALRFLDALCRRIEEVHPPGARILICSDGHVFADHIRVPDADVDAYADQVRQIITDERLDRLELFDLRQVFGDLPPETKRARLEQRYATGLHQLRAEAKADPATARLYLGITRFLLEDSSGYDGSRSALQRDCRARAYEVIRRSRAWGTLIAQRYPRSVRLSIHPQEAGAAKFGIRLLDAPDAWMTPWHATALLGEGNSVRLVRHDEAARLGELVRVDGRPSHYVAVGPPTST